jgi:hypothetical protein
LLLRLFLFAEYVLQLLVVGWVECIVPLVEVGLRVRMVAVHSRIDLGCVEVMALPREGNLPLAGLP